ncbi:MAG TPA: tetratricopeptide repeat protein, partial [Candidatus Melainabacteria bacterium]|nr:tetratricopeptide repeat protein [Candidatus Melainabacteria bacterium]
EGYSKALSVNPRMADSYYRMGVLLNKNEHPAQALVMLNKAISLEPAGDFVREARKQIASINKDFKKEEEEPAGEDDRKRTISDSGSVEKASPPDKVDGKGKTALIRSFFKLKKENEDKGKDMNMFIQPPKELSDQQSRPKD